MEYLSKNIVDNVDLIYSKFEDKLLKMKYFYNKENLDKKLCLLYFSTLVDSKIIIHSVIEPIIEYDKKIEKNDFLKTLNDSILTTGDIKKVLILENVLHDLLMGKAVLLVDGFDEVLSIEANDRKTRSIVEPESEKVLRGPREGFTESLLFNISLIRRKIINPDLKFEYLELGEQTKTNICICYMEKLVKKDVLNECKKRLKEVKIDGVLDSNIVSEKIKDHPYTPLKTIGVTEKPDRIAYNILDGNVCIIIDGTPVVLYAPYLFLDNFTSNEDYQVNYYFSSFSRMMRIIGFIVTILTPGLSIAITTYHREIIPTSLAISIAKAQSRVPLPTVIEVFVLLILFELIRETGLRTPSSVGSSLSIVGAIVIGQSAVEANLISAPIVIVIALTAITGLINGTIKGTSIFLRIIFLIMGSIFGLIGIIISILIVSAKLLSMKSFGIQYVEHFLPPKKSNLKDSFIRAPKSDVNTLLNKRKEFTNVSQKN